MNANKFANRYWLPNYDDGRIIYELHFTEFYDDEIIATLEQDPDDDTNWIYKIPAFIRDEEYLSADSLEDACTQIEELLVDDWNDEIARLKECIEKFNETN